MIPLIQSLIDWEAVAVREAAEQSGTPEGAARIAEARRYRLMRSELIAMQKECDTLRGRISETYRAWCGRDLMGLPLPEAVGRVVCDLRDERDRLGDNLRDLIADVCDPTHEPRDWSERVCIRNANESLESVYPSHRLKEPAT